MKEVPTDKVLSFLIAAAENEPMIERIILFGSRARRDGTDRSDYDVAVDAGVMTHSDWSRWTLEIREKIPTLCGVDLVRMGGSLEESLARSISDEGVVIYGRKK